jgi:hypothetical protein
MTDINMPKTKLMGSRMPGNGSEDGFDKTLAEMMAADHPLRSPADVPSRGKLLASMAGAAAAAAQDNGGGGRYHRCLQIRKIRVFQLRR